MCCIVVCRAVLDVGLLCCVAFGCFCVLMCCVLFVLQCGVL